MCVRKKVADRYVEVVKGDVWRSELLGRKGQQLLGCEDLDLAWTSNDMGMETGVFVDLKLTHLIPSSRIEEGYLERAIQGSDYSEAILKFLRNKQLTWKQRLRLWIPWLMPLNVWFSGSRARRFYRAGIEGRNKALKDILIRNSLS